jgi:hypothetical protein
MKNNLDFKLLFIRIIHYCVAILTCFYMFIFDSSNDVFYLLYIIGLTVHWSTYYGECCLTVFEKQLLDNTYKVGSNPFHHPWLLVLFKNHSNSIYALLAILFITNVGFVIFRYIKDTQIASLYFIIWCIWISIIFIPDLLNKTKYDYITT